jgi:hypothetical protein
MLPESGPAVRALALILEHEQPLPLDIGFRVNASSGMPALLVSKLGLYLEQLGRNVYLLSAVPGDRSALGLVFLVALSVTAIVVARGTARPITFVWMLGSVVSVLAYAGYVLAGWFFFRYSLPAAEAFCVLGPATVLSAIDGRSPRAAHFAAIALGVMARAGSALALATSPDYRWIFRGPGSVSDAGFSRVADWANRNLSSGQRLGAFQSGVIGYYSDATVYNLDGKVNRDAHRALLAGRMWRYLCNAEIDYVADWQYLVKGFLVDRSETWEPGRLERAAILQSNRSRPIHVYRVNHSHCP